jgi:hypothetical protein
LLVIFALLIGLNWTANYAAPVGETPATALEKIGGTYYRNYDDPFSGSGDLNRIRLVRYGMVYRQHQAPVGSMYQLGNEINLLEQDNAARTPEAAIGFASWYRAMVLQIKAGDINAKIIGPSVWNWDGAGSNCCVTGRNSYQWFIDAHRNLYGSDPIMDYVAVQIYPWFSAAWYDPIVGLPVGLQQVDGAKELGKPVVVTEWGSLRKLFSCNNLINQSDSSRYQYTKGMLDGMAQRGVVFALYYGSHEQSCDSNGWMSWLINRDGSLTPEGQAHKGIVSVPVPTLEQLIRSKFGAYCGQPNYDARADLNGDCIINSVDYSMWRAGVRNGSTKNR